jgi:hypothetical protein
MKITILSIGFCMVFSLIYGQSITVKDGTSFKFSTGSHNAYTTTVYETSKGDVESKWKSLLKDFKNEKVKNDNGEIFGDNILIKDWGNNPVDIYAVFEEDKKNKNVVMRVAFDLGGAYLSSSESDKHNKAEKMIHDFAVKTTKESMEDKIKDLEKVFKKLEDNQKNLEKDNKNLKSDIETYKEKIKKAESDVVANEADQVKKKSELEVQKKLVDAAKNTLGTVQ